MIQNVTEENIDIFKQTRIVTRKMMKIKKREYQLPSSKKESCTKHNRIREYFREISQIKAGCQFRTKNFLKSQDGELITYEKEIFL